MKDTRVYILDGGEMAAKEYQVYWNLPSEAPVRMPSYSVLIEHEDGRFLFDTGFSLDHFRTVIAPGADSGATQSREQTLPAQLDLIGLRPSDVTHVINSHYHFDHCGQNHLCGEAITVCHKCELEAARTPEPFETLAYSDLSFDPDLRREPEVDIYTRGYETLSGDQEIARGLFLFETPGHTLGHYSLMVKLAGRRPMLFTADACYTAKQLGLMTVSAAHVDPVKAYRSLGRIKQIAEAHDAEIFFSHDEAMFPTYLKAPGWYA